MNNKKIILMALEAGHYKEPFNWFAFDEAEFIRFISLVASAEREECAKVADDHMKKCEGKNFGVGAAIRARLIF
jgi:hypothetical protein